MSLEQRIIDLYDEYVAQHPEGVKVADAIEGIQTEVQALLIDEPRDVQREGYIVTTSILRPERRARSRHLRRELDRIHDAIALPEDGIYIDPWLDFAYPTGDRDGIDKALRHWVIEDLLNVVAVREQKAFEAEAEANEVRDTAHRLIGLMRSRGVVRLGDLP